MENTTPVITSSQILADLQAGLTRADIKVKYNLTHLQLQGIFRSPSLKNKRTSVEKGTPFTFVDDLNNTPAAEELRTAQAPEVARQIDLEEAIAEQESLENVEETSTTSESIAPAPTPVMESQHGF
jgi:hypothetical protein